MSKTVFTATEDEKLIEEVGKNRVLYDSSLEKHRDVNFKDAIWNSISSIVGRTTDDCKKRWRNIRDTYMRNKKKLGTGSPFTSKKKWILADSLVFLNSVEYERNTVTNVCDDNVTYSADDNSIDDTVEEFQEQQDTTLPQTTKRIKSKHDKLNFIKRSNDRTAIINSIQSQNEYLLARENSVDDVDIFFKSIAMTVKNLPPKGVIEAKIAALTLVSNLQEKYSVGESTTSSSIKISKPNQPHSVYSNNSSLSNSPIPYFSSSSNSSVIQIEEKQFAQHTQSTPILKHFQSQPDYYDDTSHSNSPSSNFSMSQLLEKNNIQQSASSSGDFLSPKQPSPDFMYNTSQSSFPSNSPIPQIKKKHLNQNLIHGSTMEYQIPFQSQHSVQDDPSQSSSTGRSPINQYYNKQ